MSEWISVKKRLPPWKKDEIYPEVLATNGEIIEKVTAQIDRGEWYVGHFIDDFDSKSCLSEREYEYYLKNVTHWMPLPELPK
jgi:hypothetical protein